MWGIDLNCNVKLPEIVWLSKELLDYQLLSQGGCLSGCTINNPPFVITQYTSCDGPSVFPPLFTDGAFVKFGASCNTEFFRSGECCGKIIVNNGSTITTFQFTVGQVNAPTAGAVVYTFPSIIGTNIQLALAGYGFLTQSVNYSFDLSSGTITLLGGLLFDVDATYTIFSYK